MTSNIESEQNRAVLASTLLLLFFSVAALLLKAQAWKPLPKALEAPPRPRTYRIRGISVQVTVDDLYTQLGLEVPCATLHLTLAPVSQKRAVATFTHQQAPDLSHRGYVVDTDFFGITPLTNSAHATVE